MMSKIELARVYGVIIGVLGIVGFFVSGHLFKIMNVDPALDVLRVILAAALIYVSFIKPSESQSRVVLTVVGVLYIGMGLLALVSSTLLDILPSGLTGFDVAFHIVTGVVALVPAAEKVKSVEQRHAV